MTWQSIEMVRMHQADLRHQAEMARLAHAAAAQKRARRKQQLGAVRRMLLSAVTGRRAKREGPRAQGLAPCPTLKSSPAHVDLHGGSGKATDTGRSAMVG